MGMIRSAAEVPGDEGESWLTVQADLVVLVDVATVLEEGALQEGAVDPILAVLDILRSSDCHAP